MEDSGIGAAVEQVIKLTRETNKTTLLTSGDEPKGYYYLINPDGSSKKVIASPAWHRETLETPKELLGFIAEKGGGEKEAVFIGQETLVYVYNLDDRRDVAVCPLKISPQYAWLLTSPPQMTQTDFIRLLRITFRGCLTSENLLPLIRELKFDSEAAATGNIQHGRESMGRSIVATVTGLDRLPEEIGLVVPVFENHPFKAMVKCAIEIFPQEKVFRLTPYPLEVKGAMDQTMEDIEGMFDEGKSPVFRGKP